MPRVSVILPVYNSEEYVEKSIKSVLVQTYKDFELIIINDASTDGTVKILNRYSKSKKINITQNKTNLGITKSLNKGIKKSKGEFIARIDADDWWHRNKLELQVRFLEDNANKKYGIVGTNSFLINLMNGKRTKNYMPKTDSEIRNKIHQQSPFVHSAVMFRRELVEKFGYYDETYPYAQDYELWLRLLIYTKGYNLQEFLCTRLTFNESVAHKKWKNQQFNIIRIMVKYYPRYHFGPHKYIHILKRLLTLILPSRTKEVKNLITSLKYL